MTDDKSELRECPFCGGDVILKDEGDIGNPLSIICRSNKGWCLGNTNLYPRQSKAKLIKEWNTRTEHSKQSETSAETLADTLFELGDEPGSPCQRIQFLGGHWPEKENDQGGLGKQALIDFFKHNLPSPPQPIEAEK